MRIIAHLSMLITGAVLAAAPALAHDQHHTLTEVAVNERTGEMEITHRVFAHDLMQALGEDSLDEASFYADPEHIAEIGLYAASAFRLGDASGLLYEPVYVGAERDGEFAWIYFAAPAPEDMSGFLVDNDLLADAFDDQTNMTNLRFNSHVRTAMQGPGRRDPVRVVFPE